MLTLIQRLRHLISPAEPLLEQIHPGGTLLDVGCGTGSLLLEAAKKGLITEGTGIDVLDRAIKCAQSTWNARRPASGGPRLSFETASSPTVMKGRWDTVMMIDVIHHVPREDQESFLKSSLKLVGENGRFIYKDMCYRPHWRAWMNRFHDLVVARQWIHYVRAEHVVRWAADENFHCVHRHNYSRIWYGHELLVFERL